VQRTPDAISLPTLLKGLFTFPETALKPCAACGNHAGVPRKDANASLFAQSASSIDSVYIRRIKCAPEDTLSTICRRGKVTEDMLASGRWHLADFVTIGFCEAMFLPILCIAVANLPGALIPLLSQSMLVWNFLLSAVVLRKRCGTLVNDFPDFVNVVLGRWTGPGRSTWPFQFFFGSGL
jgi:hypothetical protein